MARKSTRSARHVEPEDESARALYRMGRRGMFMGSPAYIRENIRAYEAARWKANRTGAIVGQDLADRFGWTVG